MKINIKHVLEATVRARENTDKLVSRAFRLVSDSDKEVRKEACLCLACFYSRGPRISGQAFTNWDCFGCELPQPAWQNTGVPRLCIPCAQKTSLCRDCCADLDLRVRKSFHTYVDSRDRNNAYCAVDK